MSALFHTLFYDPLYNALIAIINLIPGGDVGIAIIVLTVIVRLILFPLSLTAARTALKMRELAPKLEDIKQRFKDRELQARQTLELYRKEKINPFSSILLIILQLPVIFALYFIFIREGFPNLHMELLYFFTPIPETVNTLFLGLIDIGERSLPFAILAGLTQFIQAQLASPKLPPRKGNAKLSEDFARSFQLQVKYVLPVVIGIVAYTLLSAVALYWTTSNIFMIGQELYVRRQLKHHAAATRHTGANS